MRILLLSLIFVCAGFCYGQAQIEILRLGTVVADGGTDAITFTGTSPFNINYTIRNDGSAALGLTGTPLVEITATTNCTVSLLIPPPASVAATDEEVFTLQVSPVSATSFSFSVSIEHDAGATAYVWTFTGTPGGSPAGGGGGGGGNSGCSTNEQPGWLMLVALALLAHRLSTRRDRHRAVD